MLISYTSESLFHRIQHEYTVGIQNSVVLLWDIACSTFDTLKNRTDECDIASCHYEHWPFRNVLAYTARASSLWDTHSNSPWMFYMTRIQPRHRFRWCGVKWPWIHHDRSTWRRTVIDERFTRGYLLFLRDQTESVLGISPLYPRSSRVGWIAWSIVRLSNELCLPSEDRRRVTMRRSNQTKQADLWMQKSNMRSFRSSAVRSLVDNADLIRRQTMLDVAKRRCSSIYSIDDESAAPWTLSNEPFICTIVQGEVEFDSSSKVHVPMSDRCLWRIFISNPDQTLTSIENSRQRHRLLYLFLREWTDMGSLSRNPVRHDSIPQDTRRSRVSLSAEIGKESQSTVHSSMTTTMCRSRLARDVIGLQRWTVSMSLRSSRLHVRLAAQD